MWSNFPELPLDAPEPAVLSYCPICGYEVYRGEPISYNDHGDPCHLSCTGSKFDEGDEY